MSYLDELKRLIAEQEQREPSGSQEVQTPEENPIAEENYPHWYTPEDRKAADVLAGICKGCSHFGLMPRQGREFQGFYCDALKQKLERLRESCPEFYSLREEIEGIAKELNLL